jgi:APA family basic amino acid/polyamine antiporter
MRRRFPAWLAWLERITGLLRPLFVSIEGRLSRVVGTPAIYAIAVSAIGASIYITLGIVADRALALTPLAYVAAGIFFVVTMLTYVEANSLHPERGGASTFARYAFDELWSFIAGWGIALDYLIVMALCAFAIPDYLAAFWGHAGDVGVEHAIAGCVIAWAVLVNLRGLRADELGLVLRFGVVNVLVLLAVIAVGVASVWDWSAITEGVELGEHPEWDDLAFGAVIAGLALTGLEAASGVAGEIRPNRKQMSRVIGVSSATAFMILIGVSLVSLMALPVVGGVTPLGEELHEAPVLGVVSSYDWFDDTLRYVIGATAAIVLIQAITANMMGVSRLAYSLATNRQIPSAIGRLDPKRSTPWVAITVCGVLAFALVLTSDLDFLAGTFAFGATLAFAIAHASVIRLRFREATARRPYRMPFSVKVGGGSIPLPALLGFVMAVAAWVSVVILHEGARYAGGTWLIGGLLLYVIYRRGQDKPLRKRFTIPATVLQERGSSDIEFGSILVPVFGGPLDDDIVGTAGRLAAEEAAEGEGGTVIEAIYVLEIPMSLPIDARVPDEQIVAAKAALRRAKEVGEEYEGVEVAPATARARSIGAGIVEEARRRGVEAIVLAAEEPTRMRGGALLGGRGGPRDRYVGEMTRYVVEKAPCRVILTAPPAAGDAREREGVLP